MYGTGGRKGEWMKVLKNKKEERSCKKVEKIGRKKTDERNR